VAAWLAVSSTLGQQQAGLVKADVTAAWSRTKIVLSITKSIAQDILYMRICQKVHKSGTTAKNPVISSHTGGRRIGPPQSTRQMQVFDFPICNLDGITTSPKAHKDTSMLPQNCSKTEHM
jgi:hypothetical protein